MIIRKIEIFIDDSQRDELKKLLEGSEISGTWYTRVTENRIKAEFLIDAEKAEGLLDKIEKRFSDGPDDNGFLLVVNPVEAIIPSPTNEEEEKEKEEDLTERLKQKAALPSLLRISRAELMQDISKDSTASSNFIIMMVLSSIVAGIGLLKDNTAIIIGAMVIAPMLGPNMALSFGTVLGDIPLVRKSAVTGLIAMGIAVIISVLWGILYPGAPDTLVRAEIRVSDLVLAFVSGAAGAVAILRGGFSALVGVMVAVALLPPLIKSGLLMGMGEFEYGGITLLIFIANTICVTLASILTFFVAGIRPKYWWEEKKARKYTFNALLLWGGLLVALIGIVIYLNIR